MDSTRGILATYAFAIVAVFGWYAWHRGPLEAAILMGGGLGLIVGVLAVAFAIAEWRKRQSR